MLDTIDIQQFRGGINTNSDDGPIDTARSLLNLIPQADGNLLTRPVVGPLPLSLTPFPDSAGKVFHLVQFDSNFFILTDVSVYVLKNSVWTEVPAHMPLGTAFDHLAELQNAIKKAKPEILFQVKSYFPVFMFPSKAGIKFERISNITAPVEYDSHVIFRCDIEFPGPYQTPQQGYSQTFAIFKTDKNPIGYAVRPAWQEHLANLTKALNFSLNGSNMAAVMLYEYEYIQIPSGLKFKKSGFSTPTPFLADIQSKIAGTSRRWELYFSLRNVIRNFGINHYGIFLSAISAYLYYLSGDTRLYFLYQRETYTNGLPRQMGLPVLDSSTNTVEDQLNSYAIEIMLDLGLSIDPIVKLAVLLYDTFGAFTNAEIEARAGTGSSNPGGGARATLPHGDFLDRRPIDTSDLNNSLVDLETNGFIVNSKLLGQLVASERQLYLTTGNQVYFSILGRYDYFDVTARYVLDAPFASLTEISQTTLIFSTKSIYRVEGDIGDTISFVTKFGDVGTPEGSQVLVRYDRAYFIGADKNFYSTTRFSVEPENGYLIDKVTSTLDGPFYGIRIPEIKSFALIFSNGNVLCRKEDIGAFYSMRIPRWISASNVFRLNGKMQFYRIENRTAKFYWFGGNNDGSDNGSFVYESPTFYPSLISQRSSGGNDKSDISSLQAIEVLESNGVPMNGIMFGDMQDGREVVRNFFIDSNAKKASFGMARVKRFSVTLVGDVKTPANIRRIKVSYIRHNDPGASKNEYR